MCTVEYWGADAQDMESRMIGTIIHHVLSFFGNISHWLIKVFSNNEVPSCYFSFENVMQYPNSVK